MKKWILFFIVFLSTTLFLCAQDDTYEDIFNQLPHFLTNQEKLLMDDWGKKIIPTQPPSSPVRAVAEFESMSSVLIRYPLGFPVSFVKTLAENCKVITIVANLSTQNSAISSFNGANVNMENCSFMIANTDSYWTRDYGPWFAFDGNNQLCVIDFTYNRPRPADDVIPSQYAIYDTLTSYLMNINQTGGNYMTTGTGIGASTMIAYTENNNNSANVNNMMNSYLGISDYLVLEDPNNTYIDHIDCWGKFLAPDKVLIRSVPTSHAQYNAIEQTAQFFANTQSSYGHPFKVYRVFTPQNQPYTNSLILNNFVYVPIMNSSYDADALAAYRQAMPGYTVVGVLGLSAAPWESTDALHCRTHEIPDRRMLYVNHIPLEENQPLQESYLIDADIISHSQGQIVSDSTLVYFRVNGSNYSSVPLTNISGTHYQALIPSPAMGDTVFYYIHCVDSNNKKANHPLIGYPDPHYFVLSIDQNAPLIVHSPINSVHLNDFPLTLTAEVTDNVLVSNVFLEYYTTDSTQVTSLVMQHIANSDVWTIDFNPSFNEQNYLYYRIKATDNSSPENISYYPINNWIVMQISSDNTEIPVINNKITLKSVYPNPLSLQQNNDFKIEYFSNTSGIITFDLFNIKGQKISTKKVYSSSNQTKTLTFSLDSEKNSISSGVYFIRMSGSGNHISKKLLFIK